MTQNDTTAERGTDMVCSEDGVVVRVRSREARGEVPAFEYVVGSERTAPVAVHLRQPVPDDVAEADLGFPAECEDHWTVTDGALETDRVLGPDEQFTTVWGVRSDDHPPIEPPTIDVSPVESDPSLVADAVARGEPTADDDAQAAGDVGVAAATSAGAGGGAGLPDSDAPDATSVSAPAASGLDRDASVASRLVAEIEAGEVGPEDRAVLADAFEVAASDSANAFVEHVRDRLDRQSERLRDDLESLEDSVQQLYGVKADTSEIDSLKRGLTDLEERSATGPELRELRDRVDEHRERAEADRAAVREEVESLSETAADAERVASLATDLESLREDAVTGDAVEDLRTDVESLEEAVADLREELAAVEADLRGDFDERADRIREDMSSLADDHGALRGDHAKLEERAATEDDLDQLRAEHRGQINATRSDVAELQATLEEQYTARDEIAEEIDGRLHRSVATLVLFGVGVTGLLSSLALALAGNGAAAVTFLGGAVALVAWWRLLQSEGDASLGAVPSAGDAGE